MVRSLPGQSLALPGWQSTLQCTGDTGTGDAGNENGKLSCVSDSNLRRYLLGVHGPAAGERVVQLHALREDLAG